MSNGGTPGDTHLLPSDQRWSEDNALFAELSKLNTQVTRYVLHQLDADANRAEPPSIQEERALSERLATLADTLRARAERRAAGDEASLIIGGNSPQLTDGAYTGAIA